MVAATGVLVAAIYYVMNLRHTRRTQELQVTMQTINLFSSSAFWDEYDELMSKEWSTLEEYHQKYGAGFNFGHTVFITFEAMGVLLRRKLMDPELPWIFMGRWRLGSGRSISQLSWSFAEPWLPMLRFGRSTS